jgi:D-tyrosyl-tRNA(Tyr) deacylase
MARRITGEDERLRATGARSLERPARDGRARRPSFEDSRHGWPRRISLRDSPPRHDTLEHEPDARDDPPMIALLQRVLEASVTVDGERIAAIGPGLLVLAAVQPGDDEARIARMAERLLAYRVFADADGKMNRSLADTGGGLLLVSQFTLAADTRSGLRPGFSTAASPEAARVGFDRLVDFCRQRVPGVETGRFGAHMQVALVNDGPVTFRLET